MVQLEMLPVIPSVARHQAQTTRRLPRAQDEPRSTRSTARSGAVDLEQQFHRTVRALPHEWATYSFNEKRAYVTAIVRHYWEQNPREFQLEAIVAALDGKHVIVTAPTGAGKTRIWETLGLFVGEGKMTIVVNPLLALGDDMVSSPARNERRIDSSKSIVGVRESFGIGNRCLTADSLAQIHQVALQTFGGSADKSQKTEALLPLIVPAVSQKAYHRGEIDHRLNAMNF